MTRTVLATALGIAAYMLTARALFLAAF